MGDSGQNKCFGHAFTRTLYLYIYFYPHNTIYWMSQSPRIYIETQFIPLIIVILFYTNKLFINKEHQVELLCHHFENTVAKWEKHNTNITG